MAITAAPTTCMGSDLSMKVAAAAIASDRMTPGGNFIVLLINAFDSRLLIGGLTKIYKLYKKYNKSSLICQ